MLDNIKYKLRKTSPRTVDDCVKMDEVSDSVMNWTESINTLGKIIMWVTTIVGLLMTVIFSAVMYELLWDVHWIWFALMGVGTLSVVLVALHIIFRFFVMLFAALSSLVFNTRVHTDVALYSVSKPSMAETKEKDTQQKQTKPVQQAPVVKIERDPKVLEAYKTKINEFLKNASGKESATALLVKWEQLGFNSHPVTDHMHDEIKKQAKMERIHGYDEKSVVKLLEEITAYYLTKQFKEEI